MGVRSLASPLRVDLLGRPVPPLRRVGDGRRIYAERRSQGIGENCTDAGGERQETSMARRDGRNAARYWCDPHVRGLSLLHADFTDHEYRPHSHEALVVAVTERGGAIIKSGGCVEAAHPAALFVFNPAEPQSTWMGRSTHWRYRAFYLTRSAIGDLAQDLGIAAVPHFTRAAFDDGDLIEDFLSLHQILDDCRDLFEARQLMVGTFGRLFARHGSGGGHIDAAPEDRAICRRVTDLMRERYAEPLRLEDLAAAAGTTIFQLISLFKRTVGLTPHVYLTQVRLSMACHHLRRGMPIADAATATGFYDQSALTNHFRRSYGISPMQFAAAVRD
jgi:AraC-like DNA-binding protein